MQYWQVDLGTGGFMNGICTGSVKKSLSCHSDGQFEESTLCQEHQGGDHVSTVKNLEQMEKLV